MRQYEPKQRRDVVEHNRVPVNNLDAWALALSLEVPQDKIVILQAFLESYEGLGTVRTVEEPGTGDNRIVNLLATRDTLEECMEVLESLKPLVPWRLAASGKTE